MYARDYENRNAERRSLKTKAWFRATKQQAIAAYGGSCRCCGDTTFEFLEFDHINNDGAQHRAETNCGSGGVFTAWLKRNGYPSGFQLLCSNCHAAKSNFGGCPHQTLALDLLKKATFESAI